MRSCVFFFFQAEDGIRDVAVTGVQTCALPISMEPRGLVADFDPSTRALTVWISTQVPHMMQAVLADLFRLPQHRVRGIAPHVGGSFGIKIHVYQDDLAAVALALTLRRPVKVVATRHETFLSHIHAREQTGAGQVPATA